jgi:hypothetical protein
LNFFALIILLTLLVWILQAIRLTFSREKSWWRFGLKLVASSCLLVGAFGFFGSALSSAGALNWLPESFEWPSSGSDNSLQLPDGEYVVPHTASGRVQVYGADLAFVTGWTINASGGVFALAPSEGANFYVFTARNNQKYEYDSLGDLVSSTNYRGAYPAEHNSHQSIKLDVSPFLWPFTDPFAAWLFAALGIGLAIISDKLKVRGQRPNVS